MLKGKSAQTTKYRLCLKNNRNSLASSNKKNKENKQTKVFPPHGTFGEIQRNEKNTVGYWYIAITRYILVLYCQNGWHVFVYVVKEMCHNTLLVCCSTHHKFTFSMSICYGYRRSETKPIEWNHNNNNKWTMVGGEGQKWLSQMPTMPELKVSES